MMTKLSVGDDSSKLQLPNDWSEIKIQKLLDKGLLIDHLDGNHGELYPSAEEFSDEGVPYVSANNFSNGVVDLEGCKKLPEDRAKQFKKGIARNDDVIFAHNATVGPVALLKTDLDYVILGTTATYYRCNNDRLLNHYLLYAMQSNFFVKQYSKVMFQSTRSQVPITAQRKLSLLIPSYPEQKAIAQVLSTADAAIHTTEKLIAQKELRKKWLMQQLVTGKKRLKGFAGEVKLKVVEHYLNEISERNKDLKISNVLSVTNSRGFINQADQFDRVVASEDATNYKIVRKGQFAYNPSRVNVGSLDLLRDFESGILSPMYVVFETDKSQLLPDYFYYQLKTQWFYGHIPMFVQGSVRDSLSFDGLCSMKFFIPSIEEQTAIAQVLQAADKEISLLKIKAEKLREQKKGLMQVLLTGKVRLKIDKVKSAQ